MLPVAVPDLRFNYVFATFVNEVTGAELGTVQLTKAGTSGADQLWNTTTPISVVDPLGARRRPDPARRRRRPDRRLRHALHRVLRHRLHQRCRPHPRLEHRHRAGGAQRLAARRLVRAGRVLRDRRLQRRDPGRGRPRRPVPAHRHRRHRRRLGERRRRRPLLAHARRHVRARHVDRDRRASARRQRAAHRRAELELGADLRQGRGTGRPRTARPATATSARPTARSAPSSARSSPAAARARSAASRSSRAASPRPAATRSRRERRTRSASASPSPAASRCSRSRPTRSSSSASPAARTSRSTATRRSRTSGTRSSRAAGLRTSSTRRSPAPRTTSSGRLPEPWECVKTQTGGAVGQVEHGLTGPDPRRRQLVHGADQLAELRPRRPADRAADHHAVRHLQRLGQRHRAR